MKNILSLIAIIITIQSCTTNAEPVYKPVNSDNYVVVLDLSDRIIQKADQINIDTNAIKAVFERFEKSVQKNLVIKSKDKFTVRIIPQDKSAVAVNSFEDNLTLDLGKYSAADKLSKLNQFKANFSLQLKLLYQSALHGNKSSDYAGVDIWQYFNDQINTDLSPMHNNKVIVLTDGYFDFEDKNHGINSNNQSTTTAPLLAKMKGIEWESELKNKTFGILPVKLNVPARWLVCGIQSKVTTKDLPELETKKLSYLWKRWLKESGAADVAEPIVNSSSEKVKSLVLSNL